MRDPIYDVTGLAKRLDIGMSSAYRLCQRGDVRAVRVGQKLWRISESAISEFLRGGGGTAARKPKELQESTH